MVATRYLQYSTTADENEESDNKRKNDDDDEDNEDDNGLVGYFSSDFDTVVVTIAFIEHIQTNPLLYSLQSTVQSTVSKVEHRALPYFTCLIAADEQRFYRLPADATSVACNLICTTGDRPQIMA